MVEPVLTGVAAGVSREVTSRSIDAAKRIAEDKFTEEVEVCEIEDGNWECHREKRFSS